MMIFLLLLNLLISENEIKPGLAQDLTGAWETTASDGKKGILIMTDEHFSLSWYKSAPPEFLSTAGGKWRQKSDGTIELLWEYNTEKKELVGQQKNLPFSLNNDSLTFSGSNWSRLDNGKPGALNGAWVITGRKNDGKIRAMTPGARKTMKILSGTRFQWIAYNSETGEFFGTGGGTYTTENGKYTENIDFFSRDNSRVGASLEFNYELKDGQWHHSGQNSKGEPLYEIWSTRKSLGI